MDDPLKETQLTQSSWDEGGHPPPDVEHGGVMEDV